MPKAMTGSFLMKGVALFMIMAALASTTATRAAEISRSDDQLQTCEDGGASPALVGHRFTLETSEGASYLPAQDRWGERHTPLISTHPYRAPPVLL